MYWNVIKRQQWVNGFDNVKGPVQLCEWQYMGEKKRSAYCKSVNDKTE